MGRFLLVCTLAPLAMAGDPLYELSGRIGPRAKASVSIYNTGTPYANVSVSDESGHFVFRKLQMGTYAVTVRISNFGEARRTVEIGPGTSDPQRRVAVNLALKVYDFSPTGQRQHAISARELSIPERARREFREGQKELARHAVDSAVAQYERAVEIAPQFEAAWNNLGIIAYQTRKFDRAEQCFRQGLAADPDAYETLVNLGGVLATLGRPREARDYDLKAVSLRPNEALANSQLGQAYFALGEMDLGEKYLERAREIDPTHFSHPQLVLAEVHIRKKEPQRAAADLEDFLQHHPDWPEAKAVRQRIEKLRD